MASQVSWRAEPTGDAPAWPPFLALPLPALKDPADGPATLDARSPRRFKVGDANPSRTDPMRVLLIEDDLMIGKSLKQALQNESMVVDWTRSGVEGEEALTTNDYAAVLLDLNLPDKNGIDVLRATRQSGNKAPILVITARDDIDDRISGLDLGADDYLVKPFDMRELVARMRAVLRRRSGIASSMLQTGTTTLDLATHELTYREQIRVLSAREFALMRALLERPGIILSRAQLEERLYGWGEEVESNALDVLIHSLRKRFDKDIIHNVRGAGWMVLRA